MKIYPKIWFTFSAHCWLLCLLLPVTKASHAEEIIIAVRAHAGEQRAIKKWQPSIDYLNQSLSAYRFVMRPYTSLEQQLADAKLNRFHFILTNPATYVELEVNLGAKAMLTLVNNRRGTAQARFGSVIFTHVDNTDILEIQDLKGKSFLAVNPLGFGGWRVGLKILKDHGLDPERDFASLQFAGKQPKVVEAVRDKKVHAGIVRTDMLERLADKGRINLRYVRILNQQSTVGFPFFHSSPLYPEWPFAAMPHTEPGLAEQVKQVLIKIDRRDPAAKAGKYIGWIPALDYQPVKKLLRDLEIDPFTDNKSGLYILYLLLGLCVPAIAFYALKRNRKL